MASTLRNGETVQSVADRIISTFNRCTAAQVAEGMVWYQIAFNFAAALALGTRYSVAQVAGAIAAISPMMDWGINQIAARRVVEAHAAGDELPAVSRNHSFVLKAGAILDGSAILSALSTSEGAKAAYKTRRFFRNIMGDYSVVTIDRWAARTAYGECGALAQPNGPEYLLLEEAFCLAASMIPNMTPAQLQAIVWVYERASAPPAVQRAATKRRKAAKK